MQFNTFLRILVSPGISAIVLGTCIGTVLIPGSLVVYDYNTSLPYDSSSNGAQLRGALEVYSRHRPQRHSGGITPGQ
jgi:hypothetical protein